MPQATDRKPTWKRWALAAAALVLLALAAGAWYAWRMRQIGAHGAQMSRLLAAKERERQLVGELAGLPADTTACPPGQILQRADVPAAATGGTRPAIPGSAPPARIASAVSAAPSAASSAAPQVAAGGEAPALDGAALVRQLELATAIVIVTAPNELATGTGFFIAPNLLLTNRHVVEESAGKRLYVTSKELGSLRHATVLQATRNSTPGAPDFALLRMDDGVSPGVLDIAADTSKLAGVVAAGYPGVVLTSDASFRRLMQGDLSAAPDLNLTRGAVQSLQTGEAGMPLIVHTAAIAKGNSGGPLVDGCGRVVGVNTFISVDQSQSSRIQYAIHARVLAGFLRSANAQARIDARPCAAKG
jgi:S1-C subfamily serine protease